MGNSGGTAFGSAYESAGDFQYGGDVAEQHLGGSRLGADDGARDLRSLIFRYWTRGNLGDVFHRPEVHAAWRCHGRIYHLDRDQKYGRPGSGEGDTAHRCDPDPCLLCGGGIWSLRCRESGIRVEKTYWCGSGDCWDRGVPVVARRKIS